MTPMNQTYILTVVLIMALTGFLPRVIPMAIIRKHPIPQWFKVWLNFVPPAIFGALVFPDIFLTQGRLNLSLTNIPLLTTLLITPLVLKTKSLGVAVVAGGGVFALLEYLL
ncbi:MULTISPECIES: AzlD domain-containing protein [Acidaminococcus]|jgi:branched-subunit amino acid transport protein|uniref:AzlD domain-containing protein n=1 Tax=Acidaminococcus TaxID=904 RepID=UPI0009F3D1E1|nr:MULTISPECIES: AzlD domain-containing protein [Acidaminococcus]MDO5597453.1 AzlD domain-containing protein [Acidaminococcus sp.]